VTAKLIIQTTILLNRHLH